MLAGDGGFEPPHTESESVVLPLDESPVADSVPAESAGKTEPDLTFGELRTLTGLVQANFLTFDSTCIAGQETSLAQGDVK